MLIAGTKPGDRWYRERLLLNALGEVLLRETEALPMLLQVLLELHCVSFLDSRCAISQKITTKCLWHIDLYGQSMLTKVFYIALELVFLRMRDRSEAREGITLMRRSCPR